MNQTETQGKHTPGPWHVFDKTTVYGPGFGDDGILEQYIAEACYEPHGDADHPLLGPVRIQIDLVEAEANARLIAAAPDLLAACMAYVAAVEEPRDEVGYAGGLEAFDMAIAAIDRATGGAS